MSHSLPFDAVLLLTLIFGLPLFAGLALLSALSYRLARRWKRMPADKRAWVERRWILWPAAGFLAVYALCFAYGTLIESDWVVTTRTELPVSEPVLGYERFRIVHL